MGVQDVMEAKVREAFSPVAMEFENVSHHHAGHAGSPGTGESHFNALIVSSAFEGKTRVARYRLVHQLLAEEMDGPVHALSLNLKAPGEHS